MAQDDSKVIQEIEAVDAQRTAATIAKDAKALHEVFGADMLYVHGSATAESRELFIERATTGYYDYQGITSLRRQFRVYGDVVLVDGDTRIQVVVKGTPRDFVTRYLQAWVKRDGRWQMVTWQSTPVPAS